MREVSNVMRRPLIAFVLQAIVAGQSMAQAPAETPQATNTTPQAVHTNPLNPEIVLEGIVPQPGALFPYGVSQSWFDWKDDIYDRIGLKFGFSYQILAQSASETLPDATFDTALGDWWGFLTKWTLLNRGSENEGTLVFSMFERGSVGSNQVPSNFGIVDIGSLTTNVEYTTWGLEIENLYWEQISIQGFEGFFYHRPVGVPSNHSVSNFRFRCRLQILARQEIRFLYFRLAERHEW